MMAYPQERFGALFLEESGRRAYSCPDSVPIWHEGDHARTRGGILGKGGAIQAPLFLTLSQSTKGPARTSGVLCS